MRYKAVTLGLVLAGTALGSAALNLGRARGAAWIGQPLELVVPVQTDPGQTEAGLCAEADVFHGDSRQDGNRVQVQVLPTDQPDTFNLKITSSALIDEPVVSVYVRAGCSQKSSRKFVLLADFPSENTAAQSRVVTPVAQAVPTVVPAEMPMPVTTAPAAPAAQSTANPPAPPKVTKPKIAPVAAREPVKDELKAAPKEPTPKKESPPKPAKADKPVEAAPAAKAAASGKPRLRLDPIETLTERVKTLESTTTATPLQDDFARDNQRMQQLQTDLRTLLDQAAKNDATLAAMRQRLEKAEADRVPMEVVYGLAALVLLACGALAVLWSKRPRPVAWEDSKVRSSAAGMGTTHAAMPSSVGATDIDVDLFGIDEEALAERSREPAADRKKA
jgi:hypothetical protein